MSTIPNTRRYTVDYRDGWSVITPEDRILVQCDRLTAERIARAFTINPLLLEALEAMLAALPAGERWPVYLSDAVLEARHAIRAARGGDHA